MQRADDVASRTNMDRLPSMADLDAKLKLGEITVNPWDVLKEIYTDTVISELSQLRGLITRTDLGVYSDVLHLEIKATHVQIISELQFCLRVQPTKWCG